MRVSVDSYAGPNRVEIPQRFRFAGREVNVVDSLDQWRGANSIYRFFEVRDNDGNCYILRFDDARSEWELTLQQSARSQAD